MSRVYFYTNGINTFPGSSKNWNGKAVTHTHISSQGRAEKVEYFCGAISRAFGQKDRANKLHETCRRYTGWDWEHVHVGHSNGAAVILAMLRDYDQWPDIKALHLVCGACEADFRKNGLNSWLKAGRVGEVFVYVAGKDRALALAHSWAARVLGYGILGLHGPLGVSEAVSERVHVIERFPWVDYGHSGCWEESEFEQTMQNFL